MIARWMTWQDFPLKRKLYLNYNIRNTLILKLFSFEENVFGFFFFSFFFFWFFVFLSLPYPVSMGRVMQDVNVT